MNLNSPLIRKCVSLGHLPADKLTPAAASSQAHASEFIINNGSLSSQGLAQLCAEQFHIPQVDVSSIDVDSLPIDDISEQLIRKHHIVPISKRGRTLYIASADPTNFDAFEDFEFNTGLQTEVIIADHNALESFIESAFSKGQDLDISEDEFEQFGDIEVKTRNQLTTQKQLKKTMHLLSSTSIKY